MSSTKYANPFRCGPSPCRWRCAPLEVVPCGYCIEGTTPKQVLCTMPSQWNEFSPCLDCEAFAGVAYLLDQHETLDCVYHGTFANPSTCNNPPENEVYLRLELAANDITLELNTAIDGVTQSFICSWRTVTAWPYDCDFDTFGLGPYQWNLCQPLLGAILDAVN